jgi:hypothetical protein
MSNRAIYWTVGAILGVLLVVMLVSWNYDRSNEQALAKAAELSAAYRQAGLTPPDRPAMVARVLGDDGGPVCDTAGSKLLQGYWKLRLGVGGEFYYRPVKVDRRMLQGYVLTVKTYCPDKLQKVQDFVDDLKFDDVIKG